MPASFVCGSEHNRKQTERLDPGAYHGSTPITGRGGHQDGNDIYMTAALLARAENAYNTYLVLALVMVLVLLVPAVLST